MFAPLFHLQEVVTPFKKIRCQKAVFLCVTGFFLVSHQMLA